MRRLGRRLDWLRQHLAELESDRQKTLRHVSHELKTPLTALKEGAALLAEEVPGPLSPGQREVVQIMAHNVLGLQGRIESLLGLNAAILDARQLNMVRCEAGQLLTEAVSRHELRAQTRQIHITQQIDPGEVRLDTGKMALILDNLLANAIDFSPQEGKSFWRRGAHLMPGISTASMPAVAWPPMTVNEFSSPSCKAACRRLSPGVGAVLACPSSRTGQCHGGQG